MAKPSRGVINVDVTPFVDLAAEARMAVMRD